MKSPIQRMRNLLKVVGGPSLVRTLSDVQSFSPVFPKSRPVTNATCALMVTPWMWTGFRSPRAQTKYHTTCNTKVVLVFVFHSGNRTELILSQDLVLRVLWGFKTVKITSQNVSVFLICSHPPESTCSTLQVFSKHKPFKIPSQ